MSLQPFTHTICNHIFSSLSLCLRKQLHRNIVTYPCCVESLHLSFYLVHFDPFCLSLAWDEGSSLAVHFLELLLGLASKGGRQSFYSPLLCSWFSHFYQCKMDANRDSGSAVNGYTRCIGNGERDAGSIDLADHDWVFIVSFRNVHKVWCQRQK